MTMMLQLQALFIQLRGLLSKPIIYRKPYEMMLLFIMNFCFAQSHPLLFQEMFQGFLHKLIAEGSFKFTLNKVPFFLNFNPFLLKCSPKPAYHHRNHYGFIIF